MTLSPLKLLRERWEHAGFQRYLRNTSWLFAARVFILVIAFFVNAYLARYLGPGNFGLLNYVFSFVGLFGFLSSLGLESIANREITRNHEQKNVVIGTSFYLKILGSLLAVIAIFITARLTTQDPVLLGLITMYSLVYIFSAFGIIDVYFQSQVLSKYPALVTIIAGLISAVLKLVAIALGAGIIWLTAIYVLESAVTAAGLWLVFTHTGSRLRDWNFDRRLALKMLGDAWPLMFSAVAWSIYMKIDQVMIKNMISNESAGIYAVAAKLSEFWYFIPSSICASVFPAIINAKKVSQTSYEKRLASLYGLMFYLSFGVAAIISLGAKEIIFLLFGQQYLGAVTALRLYVWAGIGVSLSGALSYYLISENRTIVNAFATALGAVANVLLNLLLIPRYGISGAAAASFLSYTLVAIGIFLSPKGLSQIRLLGKGIMWPSRPQP